MVIFRRSAREKPDISNHPIEKPFASRIFFLGAFVQSMFYLTSEKV